MRLSDEYVLANILAALQTAQIHMKTFNKMPHFTKFNKPMTFEQLEELCEWLNTSESSGGLEVGHG